MSDASCLFCRIVAGEIPADVVAQSGSVLAFRDIAPKAPVHVLVVPRRHVASIAGIGALDEAECADMLRVAAAVARDEGIEASGYRVATNHGPDARQSVPHLHWHVMGGSVLSETM